MKWANRCWSTPNPMQYQGVLMECARCLSRRTVRGSSVTASRPKVGLGRESAKVDLPAPVYWDYAKAGRRRDSRFLLQVPCHSGLGAIQAPGILLALER